MERWQGSVAVVTGASSGIGAYLAEMLVREGLKVAGLARRIDRLEEVAGRLVKHQTGTFHPIRCDVSREQEIVASFKRVEETVGPISILVNCAGCLATDTVIDGSTVNYQRILDVNVLAPAICIREASRSMRKHKLRGHIININSMAGHDAHRIKAPVSVYCASKYAITGLTETVRNELASCKSGIKITSISPGTVRTDMIRSFGIPDEILNRAPMLDPKDVVDAIIYALSTPPHVQINELIVTPLEET